MDYIKAYRIAVVKGCFIIKNSLKKYTKNYKQKKNREVEVGEGMNSIVSSRHFH